METLFKNNKLELWIGKNQTIVLTTKDLRLAKRIDYYLGGYYADNHFIKGDEPSFRLAHGQLNHIASNEPFIAKILRQINCPSMTLDRI